MCMDTYINVSFSYPPKAWVWGLAIVHNRDPPSILSSFPRHPSRCLKWDERLNKELWQDSFMPVLFCTVHFKESLELSPWDSTTDSGPYPKHLFHLQSSCSSCFGWLPLSLGPEGYGTLKSLTVETTSQKSVSFEPTIAIDGQSQNPPNWFWSTQFTNRVTDHVPFMFAIDN